MSDPRAPGWSGTDVVRAERALAELTLVDRALASPERRERVAALVAASAADALLPLDSPHRFAAGLTKRVKGIVRRIVWSRSGAPRERQAELAVSLIRVLAELASRGEREAAREGSGDGPDAASG